MPILRNRNHYTIIIRGCLKSFCGQSFGGPQVPSEILLSPTWRLHGQKVESSFVWAFFSLRGEKAHTTNPKHHAAWPPEPASLELVEGSKGKQKAPARVLQSDQSEAT
jgi:hypothetical protein